MFRPGFGLLGTLWNVTNSELFRPPIVEDLEADLPQEDPANSQQAPSEHDQRFRTVNSW